MIPQSNPKANYNAHRAGIDAAVARVLESGWYILGKEVEAFEQEFSAAMGTGWSVGVANGTDAIEIALRALGVVSGDAVLTVSHTAVATASAIGRIGAIPIFIDIDPARYTMHPASLEAVLSTAIGRSAKALVIVHLYGMPADLPAILALTGKYGIPVVEDCAQAHGASLKGRPIGTWGDVSCFSFYPTKNLGALGDGGSVCGGDAALCKRVRLLREYGWHSRYISESFGFNSRLDELQAAILREKLPFLPAENNRRREIAERYGVGLQSLPIRLPTKVTEARPVYHQYVIESENRDDLRKTLDRAGISTLVHYPAAVHQQPAFQARVSRPVPLPHTEAAISRILSLPIYPELDDAQVDEVTQTIQDWATRG